MDNILKEKAAQLFCFAFQGSEYSNDLKVLVEDIKVGGIIYFSRNIKSKEQVLKLNSILREKAKTPLFIGLDQEGGVVQRIKDITLFPGAMALSSARSKDVRTITKRVGLNLSSLGFNINFAPVADVNNNKDNPVINSRSYSDDEEVVSKYVIEAFSGFQDAKILPTAKHFLGHGDTSVDSHVGLPTVKKTMEELEKTEVVPFKKAIEKGIDGIMLSHILYPALDKKYPASLSYNIVHNYLIKHLGFKGLIVTDSLTMGAINNNFTSKEIIEKAVNAGVDMMIFCGKADINDQKGLYQDLLELIEEGKITEKRIEESYQKIMFYKKKYYKEKLEKLEIENDLSIQASLDSISLVRNESNLLPLTKENKVLLIYPKIELFTLVDDEKNDYQTLNDFLNVEEIIINQEEIENNKNLQNIITKTKNYDKIILATYNVCDNDYQTKIFKELNPEKTIIVSMRSPYDYLKLSKVNDVLNYICIYEPTTLSFSSLAKCLKGEHLFKGILPIKLGGK